MEKLAGKVVALNIGGRDVLEKDACTSIELDFDGIVGDRHRSYKRGTWAGNDKQPEGTIRRNERQWSAMSIEEIADISSTMDLAENLAADELGANICFEGIDQLSRLPKGSILKFPSGAELMVEEYNHPCHGMGKKIAATHESNSGAAIESTAFSKAAKLTRGLVGVVEVPGTISVGDSVEVTVYEHPSWLERSS